MSNNMIPDELRNDDLVVEFLRQREPTDIDRQLIERFEVAVSELAYLERELRELRADLDGDNA